MLYLGTRSAKAWNCRCWSNIVSGRRRCSEKGSRPVLFGMLRMCSWILGASPRDASLANDNLCLIIRAVWRGNENMTSVPGTSITLGFMYTS